MAYGVQLAGFIQKPRAQILSELEAAARVAFGDAQLDVSEDSFVGLLLGVVADNLALNWETAQGVYSSAFTDGATGVSLERICALTRVKRTAAFASRVDVLALGNNALRDVRLDVVSSTLIAGDTFTGGSSLASATVVSVSGGTLILSGVTGTFIGGEALVGSHSAFASGAQYFGLPSPPVIPAGTTFDSGAGTTSVSSLAAVTMSIVDGINVGAVLRCQASATGPIRIPALSLTRLTTALPAIVSFSNPLSEVVLGAATETDDALRVRREALLQGIGGAALDAIRAKVLGVTFVTEAYVFLNDLDAADTYGQPGHSFQVVVRGGADSDIAAAILGVKPVGIYCHGTTSLAVLDSVGVSRTMRFTRPTAVPIYVTLTIETYGQQISDAALTAAVQAAIVALETSYRVGNDVVASRLVRPVFDVDPTIQNVAPVLLGYSASPSSSATLGIGPIGFADFDASRIVVNVVHLVSV